jgi:hypothetical protein
MAPPPIPDVDRAPAHSIRHRREILASELCGCFYCLRTFAPEEIEHWLAVEETALCPHCAIDSVLGSASGFPITAEFLQRMHARWFSAAVPVEPDLEEK